MKFKKTLQYSVQKTFESENISNKTLKKYFTFNECDGECFEEFIKKQMIYRTDEWVKFEDEVLTELTARSYRMFYIGNQKLTRSLIIKVHLNGY